MEVLLTGSLLLSVFHALIPSHWLPVLAVGRQEGWSIRQTLGVTFLAGLAHAASTVIVGVALAAVGRQLSASFVFFTHWAAPVLLTGWGIFYLIKHYYHRHFHLQGQFANWSIIVSLSVSMFFSPCLEIEGYFLAAGQYGNHFIALLALIYTVVTITGMLLWMSLALGGLKRLNWHAWEHNAGLITGLVLIASGATMFCL